MARKPNSHIVYSSVNASLDPVTWSYVGTDIVGRRIYNVCRPSIRQWISEMPKSEWQIFNIPDSSNSVHAIIGTNYVFTEQMEAWFKLRWS